MKKLHNILIFLLVISGCNPNAVKSERSDANNQTELNDSFKISIYNVYRHRDTIYYTAMQRMQDIENFTKIIDLDYDKYPDNLAGITTDKIFKQAILDTLHQRFSDLPGIGFAWSTEKINNMQTGDEHYHLYMLKKPDRALHILPADIVKAKAEISQFSKEPQVTVSLTEQTAKKWTSLTTMAAMNENDYLAFVIDKEVRFCPRVNEPITVPAFVMPFDDMKEAKAMAARIK